MLPFPSKILGLFTIYSVKLVGRQLYNVINETRQIPNRNFHGDALVPLPQIFPGRYIFHSENPFGNFGLPFKKSRFPEKISVWGDNINLSIYTPSEIFWIFWVNGKQPGPRSVD